jgi:hypothetical protein
MKHCLDCGAVALSKQCKPGSTGVEVALWVLLIVPGLAYSIWRMTSRYEGCSQCGSRRIVPAGENMAQTALGKLTPMPSSQSWFCEACGKPIFKGGRFCESCGDLVAGASKGASAR